MPKDIYNVTSYLKRSAEGRCADETLDAGKWESVGDARGNSGELEGISLYPLLASIEYATARGSKGAQNPRGANLSHVSAA